MPAPVISVVVPFCVLEPKPDLVLLEYTAGIETLKTTFELLPVAYRAQHVEVSSLIHNVSELDPRVRCLSAPDGGWGHAVQLGVAAARGDLICYTNPARTSATDLVHILRHSLAHSDSLIKANRRIYDGWRNRLGSLLFVAECRALFDLAVWDINGTPKAFPRRLSKLLELNSQDDLIDLELAVVCRQEGYSIIEVSLPTIRRQEATSTTINIASAIRMYLGALQLWRRMHRQ